MTTAIALRNQDLMLTGPVGSLDAYIQSVSSIPVLSKEDEQTLARDYIDNQNLDAARELVMAHLRFVVHIAKGYAGYGLPIGDLVQEGNVGLMKAVKRFDPNVGVRLVSFAVHWIRAEIHEFVLRNWRVVKVATTKAQRKLFFNLRKAKKNLSWLTHEETVAVAKDLGVSEHEVTEMEKRLAARDATFDLGPSDDEEKTFAPAAFLESENADPADLVESADWQDDASARLAVALQGLDDRSRDILQQRWLSESKSTLHEMADRYGVSAERIRQIENAAIKKLKVAMAA
ncbi:MAG: RNA polymerase sigma factor RpoH [Pseudomonadota bacterium]